MSKSWGLSPGSPIYRTSILRVLTPQSMAEFFQGDNQVRVGMDRRFLHKGGRAPHPPPWNDNQKTSSAWREKPTTKRDTEAGSPTVVIFSLAKLLSRGARQSSRRGEPVIPPEATEAWFLAKLSTQRVHRRLRLHLSGRALAWHTSTQGPGFITSERLQNPACEGSFASSLALVLSCWVVLCLNHFGKIPLKCNQYLQPYFNGGKQFQTAQTRLKCLCSRDQTSHTPLGTPEMGDERGEFRGGWPGWQRANGGVHGWG